MENDIIEYCVNIIYQVNKKLGSKKGNYLLFAFKTEKDTVGKTESFGIIIIVYCLSKQKIVSLILLEKKNVANFRIIIY